MDAALEVANVLSKLILQYIIKSFEINTTYLNPVLKYRKPYIIISLFIILCRMPKSWIHPQYYENVEVNCICGANFTVNATVPGPIKTEICPSCHPVYTGKKETKVVKGRMEKFIEKQKKMEKMKKS